MGKNGIFLTNFRLIGHFEKIPYDKSTVRSCYHIREYDVFRLRHVRTFLFFGPFSVFSHSSSVAQDC
jgi:hypothetical protein